MGIQKAYIEAIRSAKEFIYVENQYFLGGAAHWLQHKGVQAHNLIPYEIASRIATAISNDQRFVAYIVIPLFPEGLCCFTFKLFLIFLLAIFVICKNYYNK